MERIYLCLTGMFPPTKKQVWNRGLGRKWQAIPIHTIPEMDDYVLNMKRPCPKYKAAFRAIDNMPEIKALDEKHADFFKELTEFTGHPVTKTRQIHVIHETLQLQESKGLK